MLRRLVALALWLATVALALPARAAELTVTFFDVGQGDAALIVSPTGKTVLIDAGPPAAAAHLHERLAALLHAPLDLALLTHPHLDHLGGMEAALSARGAALFMDSGFDHPSESYGRLLSFLEAQQVRVVNARAGRKIDLGGGAVLTLLGPPEPFLEGTRSDVNANSVVARLTYGARAVLFTGDAEEPTERLLLQGGGLRADVLKVAHHGSGHSSTRVFLQAVQPTVALISVGAGNDYGHPSEEAVARLQNAGARVYRTDLDGEVTLHTDGARLRVETSRARAGPQSAAASKPKGRTTSARADAPVPGDVGFVASTKGHVFHRGDCAAVKKMKARNRVRFGLRTLALASGRSPAKDCNP